MVAAAFMVGLLAPPCLWSQDVAAVLAAAEKAYHATNTFRADFVQTIDNPMLGKPEVSRGTMFLNPPDRFAMRFADPKGDRIVADGTWMWLFTPSTTPGQVIREPIPRGGAISPNFFAQFVDRPLERYYATLTRSDTVSGTPVYVVRLVPKGDQPFRDAVISIGKADHLLRRVSLVEESGQRRVIVLRSLATGMVIPEEELKFRPPSGVKVVTP